MELNYEFLFNDNSTFKMPQMWVESWNDKLHAYGQDEQEVHAAFLKHLDQDWEKKTYCDKFGPDNPFHGDFTDDWNERENFRTKAELAERELYTYLRSFVMGRALAMMAEKHPETPPPKVYIANQNKTYDPVNRVTKDGMEI